MSTIGTEICGSSSRGSVTSATRPSASAASRKSGVSGEAMKAASGRRRCRASWQDDPVAGAEAGQDFDTRLAAVSGEGLAEDDGDVDRAGRRSRS